MIRAFRRWSKSSTKHSGKSADVQPGTVSDQEGKNKQNRLELSWIGEGGPKYLIDGNKYHYSIDLHCSF